MYEKLFRSRLAFIDAATKPAWTQSGKRDIRPPEEDAQNFHRYVQAVYICTIAGKTADTRHDYVDLALLYGLGERM